MRYSPNPDQKEITLKDFAGYARPRSKSYTRRWILCEMLAWGGILIAVLGVYFTNQLMDSFPELVRFLGRISLSLIPFFPMLRRLAARYRVDSLDEILSDNRATILYLRPFSHHAHETPSRLKRPSEMILRAALKNVCPLVAVGNPEEGLPPLGATRIYFPKSEWKDRVAELMSFSSLVIIETGRVSSNLNITYEDYPEGLTWEMETATSCVKSGTLLVSFI